MSIHKGHRQRLRNRFLDEGLDSFEQHEVLELLLFHVVPQKDTNPIAHELINRFGSFSMVLEAPVEELEKVPGISRNGAVLLKLAKDMGRYYQVNRKAHSKQLRTLNDCGDYIRDYFLGKRNEVVYLLCLDAKCNVLSCCEVGEGSVNSANVPIRRIVEIALASNATSVVLAHNHPSGDARPSAEDIATTHRVAAALSSVDIFLVDHIVVAYDDYVSMVQSGYRFDDHVIG